jgi:hypothetical protein
MRLSINNVAILKLNAKSGKPWKKGLTYKNWLSVGWKVETSDDNDKNIKIETNSLFFLVISILYLIVSRKAWFFVTLAANGAVVMTTDC